jgi:hypothetical protein
MNKLSSISKKYIVLASIFCSLFIFGHQVIAQNDPTVVVPPVITTDPTPVIGSYKGNCNPTTDENCYQFLEALPTSEGDLTSVNTGVIGQEGKGLGGFIMFAFEIGVGIAGVMGVVMLTIYGFQYAANDKNIATFEVLKDRITKVVLGLLLLLGIFVILNTINPDLLIVEPSIKVQEIKYNPLAFEGDLNDNTIQDNTYTPVNTNLKQRMSDLGIYCPGSGGSAEVDKIARSFKGKVTYRYGGKGTNIAFAGKDRNNSCPSGSTLCIDCSGYINIVHKCAGIPAQGGGTADIFSKTDAEKITSFSESSSNVVVNGKPLKPGDLIGGKNWHVFVYIGNGIFSDSTSDVNGRSLNKMVRYSTGVIKNHITRHELYVNRI